jgi:hypothetical protein
MLPLRFTPQGSPLWPACKSQRSFVAQIKKLSPQPTLVMEVDTGLAPNACVRMNVQHGPQATTF